MQNNSSDKKVLKSLIREFFGKRLYWFNVLRSNKLDNSILCDVAQPEWDGDSLQGNPPAYQRVTQTTNHLIQVRNKQVRMGLNLLLILCSLTILIYIFMPKPYTCNNNITIGIKWEVHVQQRVFLNKSSLSSDYHTEHFYKVAWLTDDHEMHERGWYALWINTHHICHTKI